VRKPSPKPPASAFTEDRELLPRLRAGDESAFRTLLERHHGSLLRLARIFVSSQAIAEEVVQDTWLGVINGLSTFEGRSTLKTWIFRILTNRAQTRGKREARSRPFSSLADPDLETKYQPAVDPERFTPQGTWADPPEPWGSETPEKMLLRREVADLIDRAITELPQNQRTVVTLRDVEGLDREEVCNILEISETNQRVLLHRGRSRLRSALERYFAPK
jgi:RNA polymerase sigma-70 factor, ECF subfamily